MGQITIYSLPTLRRQILFNCIKPTDIAGLSSFQFTPYGHAFYLQSSSELTEVSFTPETNLLSSMIVSYDKFQRKNILRTNEDKTIHEKHQETPSKDSITSTSSPPKSIEPEEPVSITTVKSDHYGNNSINSDSAIDVHSINNQLSNFIHSDEITKSIEQDFCSNEPLKNGHDEPISPISPKSSKKGAAPLPPSHSKPSKLSSVKLRQAPTINDVHCFNGTTNQSSTSQTPSIHT
jgi:hypothetical protein